jgi:hypothetical protein
MKESFLIGTNSEKRRFAGNLPQRDNFSDLTWP